MKKIFTLCVVLCLSYLSMGATNLKHEFRATWLATVSGIDWPETEATNDATREQQKQELIDILDKMKAGNLNAVCFQVRSLCDAMYQSSYEPWSIALTGTRGKDPGYDPLQFAIDEAHKRGMELHVWVNPFRASTSTLAATDMLWDNAGDWLIKYNNSSFSGYLIDPGYPESRAYVVKVLMEIINNYDVDGLVMDDYFYAYGGTTNQDSVAQALHYRASEVIDVNNNGNKIDDWRRSNVDNVIKAMYDSIQVVKPWVRFGMGPGGIWTTDSKAASAYGISLPSGISGSDIYNVLYCNTVEWIKGGYVDYVNPQIYWSTQVTAQDYDVLCQWWSKDVCEHFSNLLPNGKKVHHFPSPAAYKVYGDYPGYEDGVEEMKREMDANRANLSSGYTGAVFYNTTSYLKMYADLAASHFKHTALTPPMDWKSNTALAAPTNLTVSGSTLSWQHATAERFTVYVYPKGTAWSTAKNDPAYLQGVIYGKSMDISGIDTNANDIAVCAYDRYGVEHEGTIYSNESGIVTPPASGTITYELNGGMMNEFGWTSKNDMFQACMADCGVTTLPSLDEIKATGNDAALTTICAKLSDVSGMLNFDKWDWLEQYIMEVQNAQAGTSIGAGSVSVLTAGVTSAAWRYALAAFFIEGQRTTWPYSADFSQAGKDEAYIPAWKHVYTNPTSVTTEFTLYDPCREGYTFLGWYANADFSGERVTTINAETNGTLYAKWINNDWIITYTSTDGNIVTPYATDVFGANIVSNIYENGVGTITFDGPVTSIGKRAFYQCKSLTSITIPNSVTSIGDRAFGFCSSLTSITIPENVTSIVSGTFQGCSSIVSIVVDNNNTMYDSRNNCNAIIETATNTLIASSLNTIIPNTVEKIGVCAFYGSSITSLDIPNSVTSLRDWAFADTPIESITIPNSVTHIGFALLAACNSLTSIVVEEGNSNYDSRDNCNAIIEKSTNRLIATCPNTIIPNTVTTIATRAFQNSAITSIDIPNSVVRIEAYAFRWATQLNSITIPNSMEYIGDSVFYSCPLDTIRMEAMTPPTAGVDPFSSLPVCVIPCGTLAAYEASDWANYMGEFVEDCVEGQQIYYTSTDGNIVTPNVNAFDANIVSNIYENGVGTITFEAPITIVGDSAFHECSTLTSITIPNGVTKIKWAFEKCTSLESVELPDGITTIGDIAFHNCSSLRSIDIPNSVTYIGGWAFGASAIESLIIPTSVTHIGVAAFTDCNSLRSIVVEDSNPKYDSRNNCNAIIETATNTLIASSLNTIIPNTVTTIATRAFQKNAITSIDIPNSVVHIEAYAFRWATQLNSITIPNSVNYIGDSVFYSCPLDTIRMEAMTPPTIGVNPFSSSPVCVIPCGSFAAYNTFVWASQVSEFVEEGCAPIQMCGDDLYWEYADGVLTITGTGDMYDYADDKTGPAPWYDVRGSITTINMPNEMTKIGDYAFYKCTAMTTINMPTSLTAIGEKAFAQDSKLTGELTLPASLTTIDERAFFNCKAVTAFRIEATTPPTIPNDVFEYVESPIHVPCGYGHVYGKHTQWGMLNLEMCELLQDNVYYYPIDGHTARAVTYHSNPTDTIVLPSAVVIGGMPRTVTEVAASAFADCKDIPAIIFNEGLEYIGERAFVRCYGLQGTIVLPATLETIGERAFSYCNNVDRYTIQAMTPPVLGANAFTGDNKNALFYISCEAMDDYKVATNWSSLKSRLRDACLNIYHYNTALGANGVHTTEDTLVASIYYRRKFTPYRWETLYLPFDVDSVTVLEDGVEYPLDAWDIVNGGHYFLAEPDGRVNAEILFGFTSELKAHTPYIVQFPDEYYRNKIVTFYSSDSWNHLSNSFEVLTTSAWMQIAGNTTLQDQILDQPVYMLRSSLDFILHKTTTTLHPFECYVMPYASSSSAPTRMTVRLRGDDVTTSVESATGNNPRLTYTIDGNTLTIYPQGQAFCIYSLNGALLYSCEAGMQMVDYTLDSGFYLLHAGDETHKIML